MKLFIVLTLVALALARPDDHYDSKYENINVDEVISNPRLLSAYAHCLIGDGKCTPEGNELKSLLPDAVATACSKCTEKQKVLSAKFAKAVKTQLPPEFEALIKVYDPENKHSDKLEELLTKYA